MNKTAVDFCLLIPCYNNPEGLTLSLQSVIYKTNAFHVVIVDDGSRELISVKSIEMAFENKFGVTVLRNSENLGITRSLNIGLEWIITYINTPYVARLDCGDICDPHRFNIQTTFLNQHPEIGLLGSWCLFQDKKKSFSYIYKTPSLHEDILKTLPYKSVFIHPTVMFRVHLIEKTGLYPIDFPHAEDYALFWKMALITRTYIHENMLVTCEINHSGISFQNRFAQLCSRKKIISTFATGFQKISGLMKINLLMIIPHKLVLRFKSMF